MGQSVDLDVLNELKELLEDGFSVLTEKFIEDGQKRVEKIMTAIANEDAVSLYNEAHGLKGSSRNMGAVPLGEICSQLEAMGQNKDLSSSGTIIAALQTEFAAACDVIANY